MRTRGFQVLQEGALFGRAPCSAVVMDPLFQLISYSRGLIYNKKFPRCTVLRLLPSAVQGGTLFIEDLAHLRALSCPSRFMSRSLCLFLLERCQIPHTFKGELLSFHRRGLFPDEDLAQLRGFRATLDEIFGTDLADGAKVSASNVRGGSDNPDFTPHNVLNEDPDVYWATDDAETDGFLELELPETRKFNVIRLQVG